MKPLLSISLERQNTPADQERVRRSHHDAITEIQAAPAVSARIIKDKTLTEGVETPIAHGLGRVPSFVTISPVRGATGNGNVEEIRNGSHDRSKYVVLKANGYVGTVTLDVKVE